ncbi:hypothetical protein [uncultured Tateyamaria sp.]|uniref:hypothetical protein n=1 Tax=uncultured Tateyamaria sp. TaxID=455651 RepID=UPI0026161150|nr:hypothetical protein [uncultured Tateyamaria sp.]
MKPTIKQLSAVKHELAQQRRLTELSNAEISRMSGVHQSQVGRICSGQFKTFSFNVVQICKILEVGLPSTDVPTSGEDPSWAQVQSSMRDLWDETPEGAKAIAQMIDAVAKLAPPKNATK